MQSLRRGSGAGLVVLFVVVVTAAVGSVGCQFPRPPDVEGDGALARFDVTVTVAGPGSGIVRVDPGDFVCSTGTCTRAFDTGSTLTVTAAGASELDGVGGLAGDCVTNPCTLADLSGPRSVTATFVRFTCAPGATSCSNGQFTQCGPDGEYVVYDIPNGNGEGMPDVLTMHDYPCPMGCHASEPRCADIDTQSSVNDVLDSLGPDDLDIVVPRPGSPAGTMTISASSYDAAAHEVRFSDTGGQLMVISADDVAQPMLVPQVIVMKARTFTLRAGSTLRVEGPTPFGIATQFDNVIAGTIDVSADPVGSRGRGAGSVAPSHTCAGVFSNGVSGGGGRFCGGGRGSNGVSGGSEPSGLPDTVLAGGCSGGQGPLLGQFGGGGGGAVLLVSRTRVRLQATGLLDVSGGKGFGNLNLATGGGSGGHVLVQAPEFVIAPGARIAGRGGSGGAASASNSAEGSEGPVSGTVGAPGASCSGCGTGGSGGYEIAAFNCGSSGTGSGPSLGGGGGGAGMLRAFTRARPFFPPGSQMIMVQAPAILAR